MYPLEEAWSRQALFDAQESAEGFGRLSIEPREPRRQPLQLKKGEALGVGTIGIRSSYKKTDLEQEDGEILEDVSLLHHPPGMK